MIHNEKKALDDFFEQDITMATMFPNYYDELRRINRKRVASGSGQYHVKAKGARPIGASNTIVGEGSLNISTEGLIV